uniref:X globin n=1 Tax=Oncorhynchus kisutch TaxID=8019 RepID=A0A8C7FSU8_ONCKI
MGCAISGLAPKTLGETTEEDVAHLNEKQIQMIKESWKVIQEDIAKVGIIMFVRLFETHPECKDVFFLFRDVEDLEMLRTSRELRSHGLRSVATPQHCTTLKFNTLQPVYHRGNGIFIYSALRKYSAPLNFATFCHISGFKHKDIKLCFFVKNQQQVGHNHEVERHLLDISNFFNKSKTERLGVQIQPP